MSEQRRSLKSRGYEMRRRAEQVDITRQKIVEATALLHQTVGPAATTVAGIAAQAGVTRLTVYRHFPDDDTLFFACSAHWLSGQRVPDPTAWAAIDDFRNRMLTGLADVYRFYRHGEAMLSRINRDLALLPEPLRRQIEGRDRHWCDVLVMHAKNRLLRGVVGHALSFSTWRSLCVDQGLSNSAAVEVMAELAVAAAARRSSPEPRP